MKTYKELVLSTIDDFISKNLNGRKIIIWGNGRRVEWLSDNYTIEHIVDTNASMYGDANILNPNILKDKRKYYFVIVSCENYYSNIVLALKEFGYGELDYVYIPRKIKEYIGHEYHDILGNKIEGSLGGMSVCFSGENNIVKIEENAKVNKTSVFFRNNGMLEIGKNVKINPRNLELITEWKISDNGKLYIFDDVFTAGGGQMWVDENSLVSIGKGTTIGYDYYFASPINKSLKIGKDCMFSHRVGLYAMDGHGIFDLKNEKKINDIGSNDDLVIGKHVWIGFNAVILKNTVIGDGSIVGACACVHRSIPNNCIISGNPGMVIRKDIAWTRANSVDSMGFLENDFKRFTLEDGDTCS